MLSRLFPLILSHVVGVLLSAFFVAGCDGRTWKDALVQEHPPSDLPESVLVIANADPSSGSEAVARHYMAARKIPESNLLLTLVSKDEEIEWEQFDSQLRAPLRAKLSEQGLQQVRYLVPVYGIPYRLKSIPEAPRAELTQSGFSLDLYLSSVLSNNTRHWIENPYRAFSVNQERPRFKVAQPKLPWRMFLVTRIDGSSAAAAMGLVDRTLRAERGLPAGKGYFDYRNLGFDCGDYCDADRTMVRAHRVCVAQKFDCILNDQKQTGQMIETASDTLWAWGWYSPTRISGDYEFVDGAVGAQLTSYSASTLRTPSKGGWVHDWLERGITATWGATAEPYTVGYAQGDVLFANFFRGYNFAESAYLSLPQLNWMMVFVGDPLYAPREFRSFDIAPPVITALKVSRQQNDWLVTWSTDEKTDQSVEAGETYRRYDPFFSIDHHAVIPEKTGTAARIVGSDHWGNRFEQLVRFADDSRDGGEEEIPK